jgi:hypothetical protein
MYKQLKKSAPKRINNPINKWASEMDSLKEVQTANEYMKKYSMSLVIKEIQNKITLRFHLTLVRKAIIKETNNS